MSKINNAGMTLLRTDESGAEWWGNGLWHHPWVVRNVLCEDGKRRSVRLGQDADTFFSWPGRASIGGKTVRGFITSDETEGTRFIVYTGR